MLSRLLGIAALLVAALSVLAAYTQRSAYSLGNEMQPHYWPRQQTVPSGHYRNGVWISSPATRSDYSRFRGGSFAAGK